jgi:hypothetical protein
MTQATDPAPETPPSQRSPEGDQFPTGPEVGDLLPGFVLPDQYGHEVDLHQSRGGRRALVLFHRSARW